MASRKIEDLDPAIRDKAELFLARCAEQGIQLLVTCTRRNRSEQTALYAQGREDISKVNAMRSIAGMAEIKTLGENRIATNAKAGESLHNHGLALDVVPLEAGKPIWDSGHPVWQLIGAIGKTCGLEWGGEWKKFKEFPHFQEREGEHI